MSEFIVGLDVSKRFHVAVTPLHKKPFTFDHTRAGFENLRTWLNEIAPGQKPIFGVEPTGQFTKVLAHWLLEQSWEVKTVPGVFTKRAKFFLTSHAQKNDAVDAKVIADLVSKGHCFPYRVHQLVFDELRQLSEMYHRMSCNWTDTINRTHTYIDILFPELTLLHNHIAIRTPREVLKAYPTPAHLAVEDPDRFYQFIRKVSQGRISRERSLQILEAARNTIGLKSDGISFELATSLKLMDQIEEIRKATEAQIKSHLKQIGYAENLKMMPGFGNITTGMLLGQLGDLKHYPTYHHVIKAAGLNLIEHSSGQYKSNHRISHMGNPLLRRYLYQASIQACCHKDSLFHAWYQERIQHKPAKVVLVACMRRFLRIAHAIARDDVPFDVSRYVVSPHRPIEPDEDQSSNAIIGPLCA